MVVSIIGSHKGFQYIDNKDLKSQSYTVFSTIYSTSELSDLNAKDPYYLNAIDMYASNGTIEQMKTLWSNNPCIKGILAMAKTMNVQILIKFACIDPEVDCTVIRWMLLDSAGDLMLVKNKS